MLEQDWLAAQARSNPQGPALITEKVQWTYAQLDQQAAVWCVRLQRAGVHADQRVAVWLPNCVEYVCLVHALARLGAVLVPLNVRLSPPEVRAQVVQARCAVLISHTPLKPPHGCGACTLGELEAISAKSFPQLPPLHPGRLQCIVFTSGTTGKRKGVRLTFTNHFYSALGSAFRLGVLPQDRWLLCMPLYHVGGLAIVWRCCLYGIALVLQAGFDAEAVAAVVRKQQVTLVSLVPTMLHRLLPYWEKAPPDALRCTLLGGAPAPEALLNRALEAGLPVATTYGLTEAASQVATLGPEGVRHKLGSVGKPLMFTHVHIADEHGDPLPPGEIGQIVVRGPTVMQGYDDMPAATAQALSSAGLHTGDHGYLDTDGDLWVLNRRDDLIISGGENVYPAEVEAILLQHPGVREACVVGLEDPEWGQRVAALLVPSDGSRPEAGKIEAFVKERLASYKRPRTVAFASELPKTPAGKLDRKAVVEILKDPMP